MALRKAPCLSGQSSAKSLLNATLQEARGEGMVITFHVVFSRQHQVSRPPSRFVIAKPTLRGGAVPIHNPLPIRMVVF